MSKTNVILLTSRNKFSKYIKKLYYNKLVTKSKRVLWNRALSIPKTYSLNAVSVHNGKYFLKVKLNQMELYRLGEYIMTRKIPNHPKLKVNHKKKPQRKKIRKNIEDVLSIL